MSENVVALDETTSLTRSHAITVTVRVVLEQEVAAERVGGAGDRQTEIDPDAGRAEERPSRSAAWRQGLVVGVRVVNEGVAEAGDQGRRTSTCYRPRS